MIATALVLVCVCLACGNGAPLLNEASSAAPLSTLLATPTLLEAQRRMASERARHNLTQTVLPKHTYVRMRDGTLLFTVYWDPRLDSTKPVPTVLIRSPYGFLGTENMALLYVPFGFAAVEQNQRGTGLSQGSYCFWQTSYDDGYDTMEWIKTQEWSNGQVFQVGASADGILSTLDLKQPQPAMYGQWLLITTAFPYATLFQNSQALRLGLSKDWLELMQTSRPQFPPNTYLSAAEHNEGITSNYLPPGFACGSNFSWAAITMSPDNFGNVNFPAVHFGGWYDIFLSPQLRTFRGYDTLGAQGARGQQQIFIDPRGHCFFESTVDFPDDRLGMTWAYERSVDIFKAQTDARTRVHLPASPAELHRQMGRVAAFRKWTMYVMGPRPERNRQGMYWTTMDAWPTPAPLQLYPSPGSALSQQVPTPTWIGYQYDPAVPTPTNGGNNLFLRCGPQNQTGNDLRPDNIIFDSAPFGYAVGMLGSVGVSLQVRTNRTDTDFVVRISDVYPDGATSMLLSDNVVRMRWRDGPTARATTIPGKTYSVTLDMWELCYVWNVGHKLRVAITSSNFPRYDANPNNGNLVWQGGPQLVAHNEVLLGPNTFVTVPTVPLSALPKMSIL